MRKYVGIAGVLALLLCFTVIVKSGVQTVRTNRHMTLADQSKTDTTTKLDDADLKKAQSTAKENEEIVRALAKMNQSFEKLTSKTDQLVTTLNDVAQAITQSDTESRAASSPTQR